MWSEIKAPDVVVAGAGVVGCAVARTLARAEGAGLRVVVVDPGVPGRRASWAAGGMLSPLAEAPGPGPFLELGLASLRLHPRLCDELVEETGIDPGFRRCGKVLVALDDARAERLRERGARQRERGHEVRWLEPGELREMEPGLGPEVRGGLHLPREAVVDNRRLSEALRVGAQRAGATLLQGPRVVEVLRDGNGVRGVRLDTGETLSTRTAVVAAGAWSGRIAGLPRPLPVRPVRGQMLAFRGLSGIPGAGIGCVLAADAYLIPRREGGESRILVGASEEEAGFEARTTQGVLEWLFRAAVRQIPALARAPVAEAWAGLRPGTPDGLPVLGADPEVAGLHYATGHFRNGILLAPVTARTVAGAILGDGPAAAAAFRPDRFGGEAAGGASTG